MWIVSSRLAQRLFQAGITLVCMAGFVGVQPVFCAQESQGSEESRDLSEQRQRVAREMALNRKKIVKRFPGYGRHARRFRAVCEVARTDGRDEFLHELGDAHNEKRLHCPGCKSFYKVLSKSCRPKSSRYRRKKKSDSADAQPVFKQRQPHIIAIQRASELGYALAEDTRYLDEHYQVLTDFYSVLKNSKGITPGARDYALLLLDAMVAHFADYEKQIFKKAQKRQRQRQGLSFIERDRAAEWAELEELFNPDQDDG